MKRMRTWNDLEDTMDVEVKLGSIFCSQNGVGYSVQLLSKL